MASPSEAVTTSLGDLAGAFMEFDLEARARGFVGLEVCPPIAVHSASGAFPKIPVEQLLKNVDTKRAPSSGYNRRQFTYAKDTFVTAEQGMEVEVDLRHAATLANAFEERRVAASLAFGGILRGAEKRTAALIFNTTTWTGSGLFLDVTTEWSAAGGTPRADVKAAMARVWGNSGLVANALIINDQVFQNLLENTLLVNADTPITPETLAQFLGIERVLIAPAVKPANGEGQSIFTGTTTSGVESIWSNEYAMVCRIATTPNREEPCIGRTLHWDKDGGKIGGTLEMYRDEEKRADVVRVRHQVVEKVVVTEAGFLLGNITA